MATSEFAESICTTYFNNTEGALLRDVIDAELQEVREVLEAVLIEHDDPTSTFGPTTHTAERVRALWAKLQIGESNV